MIPFLCSLELFTGSAGVWPAMSLGVNLNIYKDVDLATVAGETPALPVKRLNLLSGYAMATLARARRTSVCVKGTL